MAPEAEMSADHEHQALHSLRGIHQELSDLNKNLLRFMERDPLATKSDLQKLEERLFKRLDSGISRESVVGATTGLRQSSDSLAAAVAANQPPPPTK